MKQKGLKAGSDSLCCPWCCHRPAAHSDELEVARHTHRGAEAQLLQGSKSTKASMTRTLLSGARASSGQATQEGGLIARGTLNVISSKKIAKNLQLSYLPSLGVQK